jgi:hypothetical protein
MRSVGNTLLGLVAGGVVVVSCGGVAERGGSDGGGQGGAGTGGTTSASTGTSSGVGTTGPAVATVTVGTTSGPTTVGGGPGAGGAVATGAGGTGGVAQGGTGAEDNAGGGTGGSDCPANLIAATEAALDAALRQSEVVAEMQESLARACYAIATDLGQSVAEPSSPPSNGEIETVCEAAAAAIDDVGSALEVLPSFSQENCGCSVNFAAGNACETACAVPGDEGPHCGDLCDARARVDATCLECVVGVTADNATFVATLEANLPAVYTVRVRSTLVNQGAVALGSVASALATELSENVACAAHFGAESVAALAGVSQSAASLTVLATQSEAVANEPGPSS